MSCSPRLQFHPQLGGGGGGVGRGVGVVVGGGGGGGGGGWVVGVVGWGGGGGGGGVGGLELFVVSSTTHFRPGNFFLQMVLVPSVGLVT